MTTCNDTKDGNDLDPIKLKEENIKLKKRIFEFEENELKLKEELRKFKGDKRLPPIKTL